MVWVLLNSTILRTLFYHSIHNLNHLYACVSYIGPTMYMSFCKSSTIYRATYILHRWLLQSTLYHLPECKMIFYYTSVYPAQLWLWIVKPASVIGWRYDHIGLMSGRQVVEREDTGDKTADTGNMNLLQFNDHHTHYVSSIITRNQKDTLFVAAEHKINLLWK